MGDDFGVPGTIPTPQKKKKKRKKRDSHPSLIRRGDRLIVMAQLPGHTAPTADFDTNEAEHKGRPPGPLVPESKSVFQITVFLSRTFLVTRMNQEVGEGRARRCSKAHEKRKSTSGLPGIFPTLIGGAPWRMVCTQTTNVYHPEALSLKHTQSVRDTLQPPNIRHRHRPISRPEQGLSLARHRTNCSFRWLLFLRKAWRPRPHCVSDIYSSAQPNGIVLGGADRWRQTLFWMEIRSQDRHSVGAHQLKPRARCAALQVASWLSGRGRAQQPGTHLENSNNALLFLEREKNRMPPGEVDELDVGDDSLDEERKIPLKLMRLGERGGDSW